MSRSSDAVGEKTRVVVVGRAMWSEEPQTTAGSKTRRQIPAAYLEKHPCKVCKGKHCTGHCRF
jgi:hypothetical protein